MSLVAISGAYGAGGSWVGRELARRLDVPFLDRAIPIAVAEEMHVPLRDAEAHDDHVPRSRLTRMLTGFLGHDSGAPAPLPAAIASAEDFKQATEDILRRQASTGNGVILGRAGVILLRNDPTALRVRLDGPVEGRITQAMHLEAIDRDTAKQRLARLDPTHAAYLKRFYGADIHDPSLYHVVLDSTSIALDSCVEIILTALSAIAQPPQHAPKRVS